MEHIKKEEEEEEDEEKEEVARGVDVVAMATMSLWIFMKKIKMESTVSYSFYKCHCMR